MWYSLWQHLGIAWNVDHMERSMLLLPLQHQYGSLHWLPFPCASHAPMGFSIHARLLPICDVLLLDLQTMLYQWDTVLLLCKSKTTVRGGNTVLINVAHKTFIYSIFNEASLSNSRLYSTEWKEDRWMMNSKECGRKRSWLNLRYYPSTCLEGLRKTMKTSVGIAGLWVKVWNRLCWIRSRSVNHLTTMLWVANRKMAL
jgi:hypothetical protein